MGGSIGNPIRAISTIVTVLLTLVLLVWLIHSRYIGGKVINDISECEPCDPCDEVEPIKPMPCYNMPCKPVSCLLVPCLLQKCKPVPCIAQPCSPVLCSPQKCVPGPCKPLPCTPQPCKNTPCLPISCRPQVCDSQNCPSCGTCSLCPECTNSYSLGEKLPHPFFGDELLQTKPDLVVHGVTFPDEVVTVSALQQQEVLTRLPERGHFGIAENSRCAVVGPSGRLLNSMLGGEIDGHDVILRVGPVHYGDDSGTRTTHYFFHSKSLNRPPHSNEDDKNVIWILTPFRSRDWQWMDQQLRKGYQKHAQLQTDRKKFRILSPEWMRFVWEAYLPLRMQEFSHIWQWPSESLLSILFLMYSGKCTSIDVYGMGYEAGYPEYFWDPSGRTAEEALEIARGEDGTHNVLREQKLREAFAALGLIYIH